MNWKLKKLEQKKLKAILRCERYNNILVKKYEITLARHKVLLMLREVYDKRFRKKESGT